MKIETRKATKWISNVLHGLHPSLGKIYDGEYKVLFWNLPGPWFWNFGLVCLGGLLVKNLCFWWTFAVWGMWWPLSYNLSWFIGFVFDAVLGKEWAFKETK